MLAKKLEEIYNEFDITGKTCFTVTDSRANFLKTFHHFGMDEAEEFVQPNDVTIDRNTEDPIAEQDEDDDIDDIDFQQINHLLDLPAQEDETGITAHQVLYKKPSHRKCACHLLNLIATTDAGKIDGVTK